MLFLMGKAAGYSFGYDTIKTKRGGFCEKNKADNIRLDYASCRVRLIFLRIGEG